MEQSEPLDKAVKAAEISLKTEEKDVEAEKVGARADRRNQKVPPS